MMTKEQYHEYLKSEQWKAKKYYFFHHHKSLKRMKKKYGRYLCMNLNCRSPFNLNVHHLNYRRIGKEYLSDLILLCNNCHHKLHKTHKKESLSLHKHTYAFLKIGWKAYSKKSNRWRKRHQKFLEEEKERKMREASAELEKQYQYE